MKRRIAILTIGLLLLTPNLISAAFSCHSHCEDAMMEFFERCIQNGGGYPCTNQAHTEFCYCMAECDPVHPAVECP